MRNLTNMEILTVAGGRKKVITVVKATYWSPSCTETCDPTGFIGNLCNGQSYCDFPVDNHMCGDPCIGQTKYLDVYYRCKDISKSVQVQGAIGVKAILSCMNCTTSG